MLRGADSTLDGMLIGTRRTFTTSGQTMDDPEGETERDDQKKTGHAKYAAKRGGTCLALLLGVRHVRDGAAELAYQNR